jgi:hypothetical protein
MDLALTLHAERRIQQREIPPLVVELLEAAAATNAKLSGTDTASEDRE